MFAAVESVAAAALSVGGVLVLASHSAFWLVPGMALFLLGVFGLAHAVAVGLGWFSPTLPKGNKRKERDDEH